MEGILAKALEYTLKYWLKSFSRDQFKLHGRTAQLSNLDINGEALHASMGLPPALSVTKAKVGKFEIIVPYVSNVQIEPIVIQIDKLDLVLEENQDLDASSSSNSSTSSTGTSKGSSYGFADKIADGMTIQVSTVNVLLEMRGGARCGGDAAWAPPIAAITIRNLLLYTTNENWQVVNLKEARDFSNNKKFIYVFKKLEWESLYIDLLPHPDMFADAAIACSRKESTQRDDDGAKRVFFGGERFLEGISGAAHITMQRTELNSALGLEVQVHITEAVCPALSEPGLRALLRFFTGLYVCLNRENVDLNAHQQSTEAAGCSVVSIVVDHIFFCIRDAEFQLELLMQSLFFSRASVSDGGISNNLTKVLIGGLFLRDTFSRPPCTLVQPSMQVVTGSVAQIPAFAKNFCPPIYPLEDQPWQSSADIPLLSLHSLQAKPSPVPPTFASQTVIACQPLMFHLQEESCLRISSFLADGIVVNHGDVLPDFSVNSLVFILKELDVTVPLDISKPSSAQDHNSTVQNSFAGARLHIENFLFSESPSQKFRLLNLEKDPACFCLWKGQPVDASQRRWTTELSCLSLCLETYNSLTGLLSSAGMTSGLWRCVELKDISVEVAMVSADGSPLTSFPPPGGVVRVGVACQQFLSNTSVEQLFFVLDLYAYFGRVSEKIASVGQSRRVKINRNESSGGRLMDKVPCDTAVSLAVKEIQLRFLEPSAINIEGMPLVQFIGGDLFIKVTHRTLGGAIAVSSTIRWQNIEIDCVETAGLVHENGTMLSNVENGFVLTATGNPQLRPVFWVHNQRKHQGNVSAYAIPFLDISMLHVIPFSVQDRECHCLSVSACISGVRLGGGMNHAEALLHRFGILGPDGGPGKGLSKGLENLSTGPLSKLFKASPLIVDDAGEGGSSGGGQDGEFLHLGMPDDVDVCVEFKDWLFALEGAQEMAHRWWFYNHEYVDREERSWHTTFQSLIVKAKSSPMHELNGKVKSDGMQRYPVELVTVGVEGLQIMKPQGQKDISISAHRLNDVIEISGGINLEAHMIISEQNVDDKMDNWVVENLKFSVKQPIEAVVTRDEIQHLVLLCKSEVDAMGRIAAGVLRLLKLEGTIGQAAIDQLCNLGSEGFDKIFSPEKISSGSTPRSISLSPLNTINGGQRATAESTVALLEEAILDSQAKCTALISNLSTSESSSQHLADIKQLTQKLESMQCLVMKLWTQI